MSAARQALCCVCGTLRTCTRPRNYRQENHWLRRPVDQDWHRETGDLKCENCGRVTTHAIIYPEGHAFTDHAEQIHKVATGWTHQAIDDAAGRRVQQRWRQGQPTNPYLNHMWWISEAEEARAAGKSHFEAICKATIPVPEHADNKRDSSPTGNSLIEPELYDIDREDPETGLWWFDVDCVDCLSGANAIRLDSQRTALREKLLEIAANADSLGHAEVASILDQFGGAQQ